MRLVRNELAKMRHLWTAPILAAYVLGIAGLSALSTAASMGPDASQSKIWMTLIANFAGAMPLIPPVLLAVLASRQVDVEHLGGGWLLSAASGVTPGRLCRAKMVALGALVAGATLTASALVLGLGALMTAGGAPMARWLGYTACVTVINLAVLALQILLSATIENQLVCVGIGLMGMVPALFGQVFPTWFNHLMPWGYYSLTIPAAYLHNSPDSLAYLDIPYMSVAGLAVVMSAAFIVITNRFDRQEA